MHLIDYIARFLSSIGIELGEAPIVPILLILLILIVVWRTR